MRRIIGSAALVAAAVGSVAATAGTASAAAPHLRGCERGTVRPASYNPICTDGSYTVIPLRWQRWSGTAAGSGEFYTHTRDYPVHVQAWRVRDGNYTRFRYQFTQRVPRHFPRSWAIRYRSGRWHGFVV
jgi:hypothetical protein